MKNYKSELHSLNLHTEKASKQCCVVKIGAESLQFPPGDSPRKVKHLMRIFKQEGCDRANKRHVIPGNITKGELIDALTYSNLTLDDLKVSRTAPILRFPPGTFVRCAQGRSRVTALANVTAPGDLWWSVELYIGMEVLFWYKMHTDAATHEDLSAPAFEALADEFENEYNPSDGQVCWELHESHGCDIITNRWWVRLSTSKAYILRRLFKHEFLLAPFMLVLQIPGMRDGLQLGTLLEIMSSKMDEVRFYSGTL